MKIAQIHIKYCSSVSRTERNQRSKETIINELVVTGRYEREDLVGADIHRLRVIRTASRNRERHIRWLSLLPGSCEEELNRLSDSALNSRVGSNTIRKQLIAHGQECGAFDADMSWIGAKALFKQLEAHMQKP